MRKPGNRMQNKETGKRSRHGKKPVKRRSHNWWRTRSIRISSRNNGRIKKQQDQFCIKLYIIFYAIKFVILFSSRTVIRTKTLFFNTSEILQISVVKFKIQNTIFQHMKLLQNFSYKFKIQNYRRYLNVSRNILT